MDAAVPGADAVAIHLDWRPATVGIAPALPEQNLRERAYWVDPTVVEQPAFTWVLGTDVSIGAGAGAPGRRPAPGRPDRRARLGATGRGHRHGHPPRPRDRLEPMSTPAAARRPAEAGRDGHRAHLPAGPAGHRRRRRHERLRRRGRPPAGPPRHRGRPVHPHHERLPPAVVELEPGVIVRHVAGRPLRGPGQGGPPGPAVRLRRRGDAGRGARAARLLRPGALALLALRPGRLARRRPLGRAAGAHHAHHGQGQEPPPRRRRPAPSRWAARSARPRSSRPPTGWSPTPTSEARELVDLYDADPDRVVVAEPGVDLDVFRPGSQHEARAAARRPLGCRAPPLRRPHPAAQGARRARQGRRRAGAPTPRPARAGRGRRRRRAQRHRPAQPEGLHRARRAARHRRPGALRAAGRPATLAHWYRAADVLAVPSYNESFGLVAVEAQACGTPVVAANVGGLPHRGRAAPASSSTATTPPTGPPPSPGSCSTPTAAPACPAPPPSTPPGSAGRAPPNGSLEVYADAMARPREASINDAEILTGIPQAVIP